MTTALDGHIEVDERGVARVAGTRLKVIHVVMDKMAHGSSPEDIVKQFPPLTLAQVHAALTYYYDHKAELDTQIRHSLQRAEAHQAQADAQPSREELLRRLANKSRDGGDGK